MIPCDDTRTPLYTKPKGNEEYVLILEKAFAKFAGCYDRLQSGFPSLAWLVLTGCEEQELWKANQSKKWQQKSIAINKIREDPRNFQKATSVLGKDLLGNRSMWKRIMQYDRKNYIMTASIGGNQIEKKRKDGLVERHAYSLLSARKVPLCPGGVEVRLVELRNPWGNSAEWNGEWSDGSRAGDVSGARTLPVPFASS